MYIYVYIYTFIYIKCRIILIFTYPIGHSQNPKLGVLSSLMAM